MADVFDRQRLRDPEILPDDALIKECLGNAYTVFSEFLDELSQKEGISLMEWRYYNDGKAWLSKGEYSRKTARGAKKIPIFWLSIWDGFFKISFFFQYEKLADLLSLPLCAGTKECIGNARPLGKTMRLLPVTLEIADTAGLNDALILAGYKKEQR